MEYKASIYNKIFPYKEKKYIYNLLTTAFAELDDGVCASLESNRLEEIEEEVFSALFDAGFVVAAACDEKDMYEYFFDSTRYVEGASVFQIMLIPTYNCNLRCPYCYEGNKKSAQVISDEQIRSIFAFAEKQIQSNAKKTPFRKIGISLYGGEPLMCKSQLEYFCSGIREIANRYDLALDFDMTTNLTLLDERMIRLIKEYQIQVQVSIDGDKAAHDVRRITQNHKGTYDCICGNLKKLIEAGLKDLITIRLNVDLNNIQSAGKALRDMKEYSNDIYFGILSSYKGFNDEYRQPCIPSCDIVKEQTGALRKFYQAEGMRLPIYFGKKSPCTINSRNKFIVDCFLDVYKCELLVNHKNCTVGKIDGEGNFLCNANFYKQMCFSPFKFEKCRACGLLTICGGGCPAKQYLELNKKDGNTDTPECAVTEEQLTAYLQDYVDRMEE